MSLLVVKKLTKNINNRNIINDINFSINPAEIVGLLGPNGAGKTTTFYSIAGLIQPSHGEVFLKSKNITKMPMHLRSKHGISYLPQESSIFQNLSVEDNILGLAQLTMKDEILKKKYNEIVENFNLIGTDQIYIPIMCIICVALPFVLVTIAPRFIPAEEVNLFFLLETIIGPIWVWLVVKEQPTLETIIGGAVIIITLGIHSFIKLREPEKIIN